MKAQRRHTSSTCAVCVQVQDVSRMDCGYNTNVDAVFDLILQVLPLSLKVLD